jgi:hypothetical protein
MHVVTLQPIEFQAEEDTCNVVKGLSEIDITFIIAWRVSEYKLNLGVLKCAQNHQFQG